MARFDVIGRCDACDGEIVEEEAFRVSGETLYCPECYEEAVNNGDIDEDDD